MENSHLVLSIIIVCLGAEILLAAPLDIRMSPGTKIVASQTDPNKFVLTRDFSNHGGSFDTTSTSTSSPSDRDPPEWFYACKYQEDSKLRLNLPFPRSESSTTMASVSRASRLTKRQAGRENEKDLESTTTQPLVGNQTEATQIVATTKEINNHFVALINKVLNNDFSITWYTFNTMARANRMKTMIESLKQMLNTESSTAHQVKEEPLSWLPDLNDLLIRHNVSTEFEPKYFLTNATNYIQYFSLGLEQISRDWRLDSKRAENEVTPIREKLRDLSRETLAFQCEGEMLIKAMVSLEDNEKSLMEQMAKENLISGDSSISNRTQFRNQLREYPFLKAIAGRFDRLSFRMDAIRSPNNKSELIHLPRDVMPESDRKSKSPQRDQKILSVYEKFLSFYGPAVKVLFEGKKTRDSEDRSSPSGVQQERPAII